MVKVIQNEVILPENDIEKPENDVEKPENDVEKPENDIEKPEKTEKHRVYRERWFIVTVVSLLQITNGALWINFASIANYTASYYQIDNYAVNWLSMVYFVTFGPFVFVAMWIIDKFGLKYGLYLSCIFNALGSLLRLFGTCDFIPVTYHYPITITGQTIASLTLPLLMSLPTKVSQDWFRENERTMSTTICSMTSTVGSALGSFIPTLIVHSPSDVPLMNFIFCGCGIAAGLLGVFCRNSKPPTPPSNTSQQLEETQIRKAYLPELIKTLTNGQFLIMMIAGGGLTIGYSSALSSILQQILCAWGYSDTFVGICNILMIGSCIIGAMLFTYIAEKTKRLEEIIKIGFSITIPAYAAFILSMGVSNGEYVIGVLCVVIGMCGSGMLPICLEIAVEDLYPIDESITSGLVVLSAQVQAAVLVPLMTLLNRPLTREQQKRQTCTIEGSTEAYDMTYSGILMVGLAALATIVLIVFYKPKYKRREAEMMEKRKLPENEI